MYDDARASEQVDAVNEVGGQVWATLGYRMQASWALPKLVWLLANQPDKLPDSRLIHQTDFITWRLAGHQVATDTSTALKTGYNLIEERWPYDVMDTLGVPESILPDVVRSGSQLDTVGVEAAATTGIPLGTPIIAGMTDGCAAQIGAGALSPGSWNSVLGTTLVLKGVTEQLLHDPAGVVYSHRSPDGGWLPGGASSTGAGILTRSFPGRRLDELNARAAEREPASVVIYPLASRGERFPFTAPSAEGFVLGTPRDEIDHYAGLLQGIAYIERLCFDYLDLLGAPIDGELRLSGGGTRSRYWSQLRANILGRPVSITENTEPALGMAILAASAGGKISETAARMVHVQEVIEPRPNISKRFSEPYIQLISELEERGWLPSRVAHHALIAVS
jgi:sugar (pentulose or hexulose) kinase